MICDYAGNVFDTGSVLEVKRINARYMHPNFLQLARGYIAKANRVISDVKTIPTSDRERFTGDGLGGKIPLPSGRLFTAEEASRYNVPAEHYTLGDGFVVIMTRPKTDVNSKFNADEMAKRYEPKDLRRLNLMYHGLVAREMGRQYFVLSGLLVKSSGIQTHAQDTCTVMNFGEVGVDGELRWAKQHLHTTGNALRVSPDHGVFYCTNDDSIPEYFLSLMADPVNRVVHIQLTLIVDKRTASHFEVVKNALRSKREPMVWKNVVLSQYRESGVYNKLATQFRTLTYVLEAITNVRNDDAMSDIFGELFPAEFGARASGASSSDSNSHAAIDDDVYVEVAQFEDSDAPKLRLRLRNAAGKRHQRKRVIEWEEEYESKKVAGKPYKKGKQAVHEKDRVDYDALIDERKPLRTVQDKFDENEDAYNEAVVFLKYNVTETERQVFLAENDRRIQAMSQVKRMTNRTLLQISANVVNLESYYSFVKKLRHLKDYRWSAAMKTDKFVAENLPKWKKRILQLQEKVKMLFDPIRKAEKPMSSSDSAGSSSSSAKESVKSGKTPVSTDNESAGSLTEFVIPEGGSVDVSEQIVEASSTSADSSEDSVVPQFDQKTLLDQFRTAKDIYNEAESRVMKGDRSTNLLGDLMNAESIVAKIVSNCQSYQKSATNASEFEPLIKVANRFLEATKTTIVAIEIMHFDRSSKFPNETAAKLQLEFKTVRGLFDDLTVIGDASKLSNGVAEDKYRLCKMFVGSRAELLRARFAKFQQREPRTKLKIIARLDELCKQHDFSHVHVSSRALKSTSNGESLYRSFLETATSANEAVHNMQVNRYGLSKRDSYYILERQAKREERDRRKSKTKTKFDLGDLSKGDIASRLGMPQNPIDLSQTVSRARA